MTEVTRLFIEKYKPSEWVLCDLNSMLPQTLPEMIADAREGLRSAEAAGFTCIEPMVQVVPLMSFIDDDGVITMHGSLISPEPLDVGRKP